MSVDDIATQALELEDPAEREAFLDQACGGDDSLRAKVESLLSALEATDGDRFLSAGLFQKKPEPETPPSETINDDAQRFKIQTRHALGGLGEVWVAWDRQLRREVALKRIRDEWSDNADAVARFRREAEITGYLEHPGVVPIYSLGDQQDGRPFYAMQFIHGRTLEQVVAERLPASPDGHSAPENAPHLPSATEWYETTQLRKLLDHFVDVCQTIDYAHSRQVVHRDLKPSNIMLGTYGQTLVVDWGLAKRLDPAARSDEFGTVEDEIEEQLDVTLSLISGNDSSVDETRQGTTLGTPRYMSPEQAAGMIDQIGPAADVYCLGATLYYILTGRAPHAGESDLKSTFDRIVQGRFDAPRLIRPEIPRPLQAVVFKAMATEMHGRYASAGALADDVERFLSDQPVSVFRDPPGQRLMRWSRKHRALAAAMVVALLLTIVGCIGGLFVRQEMNRRDLEAARVEAEKEREIEFQEETRRLEAVAASNAALLRADAAIRESRFADAAALIGVAIDRMENQPSLAALREASASKRERLKRLGLFMALHRAGEDLDYLARDTEAAVLLQDALQELGVWDSDTWWEDLPDQDLSPVQQDRLRWQIYRNLTALNTMYLSKMVSEMGGSSKGGTPSFAKMILSLAFSNVGKRKARATVELTRRIQLFRPSQSARWLGSIAAFRLDRQRKLAEPVDLGPPNNPPDGQQMAIFSLIASVDPDYRKLFDGYGDAFLNRVGEDPSLRALNVALETLRRVSDQAPDDYWIRLTMAQTYFLLARDAESSDDYARAIEHYELARAEYGRCIAIRDDAAFGYADRSTVALRQAMLMQRHPDASDNQRRRAKELLQNSLRDTSEARRLEPNAYWVHWHAGATAAELGYVDTAIDAFRKALDLGFDTQNTLDAPIVRLDDLRGRSYAIEFAYRDAERVERAQPPSPAASERASLIAELEYSRGSLEAARTWSARAIGLDSQNVRAHRIAGWCAFQDQAFAEARDHFNTAIELAPQDAVSLIGAARVAEQPAVEDLAQSERLYRLAIDVAVAQAHRSTAWFGIAKHEVRKGQYEQALAAIKSARQSDPSSDISEFTSLAYDEAKRLLLAAKAASSKSESDALLERVKELKQFSDRVASLPTASVNQITEAAGGDPPRRLPLLGGEFELPLETYWTFSPILDDQASGVEVRGGSPPLSISDAGVQTTEPQTTEPQTTEAQTRGACLTIRRADAARETTPWKLSQTIPATSGHSYRAQIMVKSMDAPPETATLIVLHQEQELARLELSGEPNTWTRRSAVFHVPALDGQTLTDSMRLPDQTEISSLEIQLRILDPGTAALQLDDLSLMLEKE